MRKNILTILVICCFCLSAFSQLQWPAVRGETKPWARWWWEGSAVTTKDLTLNMQDYKAAGLGGLEITPIYGVYGYEKGFINFLSPQWMSMLDYTLKEAKRLGLGIDLANGTGWPFGGPEVTEKDASKTIVYKTYELNGGAELKEPIVYKQAPFVRTANTKQPKIEDINPVIAQNKNLQELALDQVKFPVVLPLHLLMGYSDKGEIVNLTTKVDKSGKLDWKAPEGKWTLYALFQGLHGKMVERAAPGGEGYAIDHFSAEAAQNYFKKFDAAFRGHSVSGIRALFNDSYEVDDARGQSNWTTNFFTEFSKRRGYDLRNYLPFLFQKGDKEKGSRILFDYRTTIGELILEDFTQVWKRWGSTKGALIRNQSHGSPANLLDLYGAIDIPETEGDDVLRFKFATSAAHVTGKPLASSESATWLNEHFLSSWGDVKNAVDLFFLGGVNHIFYHGVNYSPKNEPWPGWLFYAAVHFNQANPQWKDFGALNSYVTRTQSFLQGGKPDNDILVYYPLADRYSDPGRDLLQHFDGIGREFDSTDFEHVSEWMQEHGYSFDFFSERQLQKFSTSANGIVTGGNTYQTILLPANKFISETAFQKLVHLAKGGAQILAYKNLPQDVPGFGKLAQRQALFQELLKSLPFVASGSVRKATIGSGAFFVSDDMDALLLAARIRKEALPEKGLSFTRRKNGDGATYFINNRSTKAINDWVTLTTKAASVALFDPMFQKNGIAKWKTNSNRTVDVFIQLKPSESLIVQTFNTKKTGAPYPYIQTTGEPQEIRGTWALQFVNGGPTLPPTTTLTKLGSWTEGNGRDVKSFSGMAKYTINFPKPAGTVAAWLLDLGKVNETAEVILNGKKLVTLIGPTYEVVIPSAQLRQNNTLEILVSNLMANRISYMDKNGIEWKKFYNINMSARKKENVKNGVFDASAWNPLPSGLSGPVTIQPLSNE